MVNIKKLFIKEKRKRNRKRLAKVKDIFGIEKQVYGKNYFKEDG